MKGWYIELEAKACCHGSDMNTHISIAQYKVEIISMDNIHMAEVMKRLESVFIDTKESELVEKR